MMLRNAGIGLLLIALGAASCASIQKDPATPHRRVRDSPADKVAAHRAAAPRSLDLEKEDERWLFDAARERRRAQEREDAAKPRPGKGVGTTGVVEPNRSP